MLRPLSSTGDVLQAHLEKRTRHPAGRIFDEVAYNVLRGGALAWDAANQKPLAFHGARGGEFITSMALHGVGPDVPRIQLAQQAVDDLKAVHTGPRDDNAIW